MLKSEEENHVQVISQCLNIAAIRRFISVRDMTDGLKFVHDLLEERDALRESIQRQEQALTQHARGDDAERLQEP